MFVNLCISKQKGRCKHFKSLDYLQPDQVLNNQLQIRSMMILGIDLKIPNIHMQLSVESRKDESCVVFFAEPSANSHTQFQLMHITSTKDKWLSFTYAPLNILLTCPSTGFNTSSYKT